MILPPEKKIEQAVNPLGMVPRSRGGGEVAIPATQYVWLHGEWLEVVHGIYAVKVRCDRQSSDTDGPIPPLAFELSRRFTRDGSVQLNTNRKTVIGVPGTAGVNRPPISEEGRPSYDKMREKHLQGERPHRVALNADYLLAIARAFGEEHPTVVLEFSGHPHDAIRVLPSEGGEEAGEAFLMPVESSMAPPPPVTDEEIALEEAAEKGVES